MRQVLPHLVWLGHAGDGRDFRRLLDARIQAVVQLADEEPVLHLPRELLYCRFPLVDGPGNEAKRLSLALMTVANLVQKRVPTLVCCGAGLSRSPAITAAPISLVYREPADECLKKVAKYPPADVLPGFWNEVKSVLKPNRIST